MASWALWENGSACGASRDIRWGSNERLDGGAPRYTRILLKISGEAFAGNDGGVDVLTTRAMAEEIAAVQADGVATACVVGGGNIWRGKAHEEAGMDRATADYMGMLATVINALALQDALERIGVPSR